MVRQLVQYTWSNDEGDPIVPSCLRQVECKHVGRQSGAGEVRQRSSGELINKKKKRQPCNALTGTGREIEQHEGRALEITWCVQCKTTNR